MRRIFRKPARFKIDPLCAQDKIFYVLNPDQNLSATQKKLEGELKDMEDQLETTSRGRDEAVKQLRKIQVSIFISVYPPPTLSIF